MSETQTATDSGEDTQAAPEADPSDPNAAAAVVRAELAASESRYSQMLQRARVAEGETAKVTTQLETVTQDRSALEFATITSALDATTSQAGTLKRDYTAAMEAGEFAKASDISLELGRLGAKIETLEAGKGELERRRTQQLREPEKTQTRTITPTEDERQATDLAGRAPVVQDWIKRQVDPTTGKLRFYNDPTFANKVTGAHFQAMAEKVPLNTPEYFAFVERSVGLTKPATPEPTRQEETRRSVPAAAPTRPAPAYRDNQGRSDNAIPAEAVRIAKSMGVDPVDYWKEHNRMERAGEFKLGSPFRRSA